MNSIQDYPVSDEFIRFTHKKLIIDLMEQIIVQVEAQQDLKPYSEN